MSAQVPPSLVIFRIGSIGDTVVALPCFHAIARAFPQHRRILLTNAIQSTTASSVETVLEGAGLIDEALYFPVGAGKWSHCLAIARELRRLGPEALVYLTPRPTALPVYRDLLFFRAAGIRKILGAPTSVRARVGSVDSLTGEREYEAVRLARTLRASIPVDLSPPNWDLRLSVDERRTAIECLSSLPEWRPMLAVSPGAKIAAKDWGEENWTALMDALATRTGSSSLVLVGAPNERPLAERIARRWPGSTVNLCGELVPRTSAAVLGRCDALVCHDSGPMHLAASQGTPCIALFGHYNPPRKWFPFGEGHRVIYEPRGVRAIRVERVAEAVEAMLDSVQTAGGWHASGSDRLRQSVFRAGPVGDQPPADRPCPATRRARARRPRGHLPSAL